MLTLALVLALVQDNERAWSDLADADAGAAYEAIWRLAGLKDEGVALVRDKLLPTLDADDLKRALADLDRDDVGVRDAASRRLAVHGLRVEPMLRGALKTATRQEVRQRLQGLLDTLAKPDAGLADVPRRLAALRALERIGSTASRDLLKALAAGASSLREREAAAEMLSPRWKPAAEGPQGQRAFDDLAALYRDKNRTPDVAAAIDDLKDASKGARAGAYLAALLAQSMADESNGRAKWMATPFWGGGAESAARDFRKAASGLIGGRASGEAAVPAIRWLLDHEMLPDGQAAGMKALKRTEGSAADGLIKDLLAQPHPNEDVAAGALEEVSRRKLAGLAADVRRLCMHYRTKVREAARAAAPAVGLDSVPPFAAAEAFTPFLDAQLRTIARMVLPEIPKDAAWKQFKVTYRREGSEPWVRQMHGWLLGEAGDSYRALDRFGVERLLPKKDTELAERTLAEEAADLLKVRAGDAADELSRRGGLSGQFEPGFVSAPELLVSAWLYVRGDRATAASLFFPRLDAARDDRWMVWIARDLLGHAYHQEMLLAFSHRRDYAETIAFAKHLSKAEFDDYEYQQRARELAAQLERRRDDFATLTLPSPEAWKAKKEGMGRPEQIKFLAERLRLLNCMQWGQPGGVDYGDAQHAASRAARKGDEDAGVVINPYTELRNLTLGIGELPALIPYLADENFIPTFSYWRDFHPSRTLHRVNWVVADIVNSAAVKDLADLGTFVELDEAGRKAHLERAVRWCIEQSGKPREQIVRELLQAAPTFEELGQAAVEALKAKDRHAIAILASRMKDFPRYEDDIAEICHAFDSAEAVPFAREWIKKGEVGIRFWSALILLKHGDRLKREGWDVIQRILVDDDGSLYYPRAVGPLLALKTDEATDLACGIIGKKNFDRWYAKDILHHLILSGRQGVLDYIVGRLDSTERSGTSSGTRDGKQVERSLVEGDTMAGMIADWRTDKFDYDTLAPDAERAEKRVELRKWIHAQFDKIKSGGKADLKDPPAIRVGRWRLDSP